MVTKPTGNPRGRPPKPKPPPRAAHRPKVPFSKHSGRYRLAMFQATKIMATRGARLFASIQFGERVTDLDTIPAATRAEIMRKYQPGYDPLVFDPAGTNGSDTKRRPNSWAQPSWPGTVDGGERTLHKQLEIILNGDNDADKIWLSNMALAFIFAQMAAFVDLAPPDNQLMFLDSLRGAVILRAGAASEPGEREHAVAKILPAIDEATARIREAALVHAVKTVHLPD